MCDMASALHVQRDRLEGECVVIVTTLGSVKREEPEYLKAFQQNGALLGHFSHLTPDQREALLSGGESDALEPNLKNVLRMHRPVVVVDEAHNARTPLAFETLRRFGPSAVLELTATPAEESNVVVAVSASRLKGEEMIKLPVMLRSRRHGRDAIRAAVEKRQELQALADAERERGGYVRPIVLYHAENKNGDLTVEEVKRVLVEELGVEAGRVAICTGNTDELDEVGGGRAIMDEANPIEHIVTVQKLREGWDCPFAYVLCSVANLGSTTAVEQLLGRVLRMPYAKRRGAEELNRAYCYATSGDFQEAAGALEVALSEGCGFTKYEAQRAVEREVGGGDGGLFGEGEAEHEQAVSAMPELERLPEAVRARVGVEVVAGGGVVLTWTGDAMSAEAEAGLAGAFEAEPDRRAVVRLARKSRGLDPSPAGSGVRFAVPALAIREGDGWSMLEDQPTEEADFSLDGLSAELSESEFSIRTGDARLAELDVTQTGRVRTTFVEDLDRQVYLFERSGRDTAAKLTNWLDRHVVDRQVRPVDKRAWLLRVVTRLLEPVEKGGRGYGLPQLDRHRMVLRDVVTDKVRGYKLNAEREAFKQLTLDGERMGVDMSCMLRFPTVYPADRLCEVKFTWQKHYYPEPAAMNGFEVEVAKYLDSLPGVLHWVRNLDGPHHANHAFWLRLPHGRFYPDFVAELVGERYLVVESKGRMLAAHPAELEKKGMGELWAAQAPGELGFVWAEEGNWRAEIDAALATLGG